MESRRVASFSFFFLTQISLHYNVGFRFSNKQNKTKTAIRWLAGWLTYQEHALLLRDDLVLHRVVVVRDLLEHDPVLSRGWEGEGGEPVASRHQPPRAARVGEWVSKAKLRYKFVLEFATNLLIIEIRSLQKIRDVTTSTR